MQDVIIRSGGLADFQGDELEARADVLAETISDPSVSIGTTVQRNFGVPLPEIVHVALPWAGGYAASKAMDATLRWARGVWEAHRQQRENPRPLVVNIYGPKGEVLKRVVLDEPVGAPEPYDGAISGPGFRTAPPRWRHGPRAND